MNLMREGQFPAASIGRNSGARLQQAAAHEAHPLLSGSGSPTSNDNGAAPKYVPYTPRQRVIAAAATTMGTIVHPPSPQQYQGNATSKLQLMHLKAAAQNIGLDTSTVGWAMLEKLVTFNEGDEWNEIWNTVTSGKATLLLPLEQSVPNEKITAELLKDHIVLLDGSSRKEGQLVTMSGIRGTLLDDVLTLRSTMPPLSKPFQDILSPVTRSSALSLLPPLPIQFVQTPQVVYPSFAIPFDSTVLPLPPRIHPPPKPPLPPRPSVRSPSSQSATPSRIPNPFASLFGTSSSKPSVTSPSNAVPPSPPVSIHSLDPAQDSTMPVDVTVFTIDRKIIRKDVARDMTKALKNELKAALASASVPTPGWVVDRVNEFASDWFPFVKISKNGGEKALGNEPENGSSRDRDYQVNSLQESTDDIADRLQDFFVSLEQDLQASGFPPAHRNRGTDKDSDVDDEKGRERKEHEQEIKIREIVEAVERAICSLFYDRLFMQPTTDDASHDETLTSRIAALNMLDLGLEHLDVIVSKNESDVAVVVKACGEMLSQLDPCRCPADKAAILVAAHKVLVDGLSRLPPIRLKTDGDVPDDDEPLTAKPRSRTGVERPQSALNMLSTISRASPSPDRTPTIESTSRAPSPLPIPAIELPPPPVDPSISSEKPPTLTIDVVPPPQEPTPVSGDVLLPMLIFSVVKANPPHLVSNLLFTQRFRNQVVGGEESYCLINLTAVAEFLENVDLEALGLVDSDKVMSAADLTPISLTRSPVTSETPLALADGQGGLRGRVEQQVDAIADSANKVISGVVDSSFGILRALLPQNANTNSSQTSSSRPPTPSAVSEGGWKSPRPAFGLLRRESGFSIASIAASLPIAGRSRANTANSEDFGQPLVTVSRPASVRSRASLKIRVDGESSYGESESGTSDDDGDDGDDAGGESESESEDEAQSVGGDARSIRSFESMLAAEKAKNRKAKKSAANAGATSPHHLHPDSSRPGRKSLSDRLAHVSGLAASLKGSSPPSSRRNSFLLQLPSAISGRASESPASSRSPSPTQQSQLHLAPPIQRFVDCNPGDLRLSEIGELLRDYRRLVEAIRSAGGFDE